MSSPLLISNGSAGKSGRILIVGATGFIGQFITQASLDANRRTYILVRSFPNNFHSKIKIIKEFEDKLHVNMLHSYSLLFIFHFF
ncbi:hypothetical protein EJD97_007674, partial [Solanum chilense]